MFPKVIPLVKQRYLGSADNKNTIIVEYITWIFLNYFIMREATWVLTETKTSERDVESRVFNHEILKIK